MEKIILRDKQGEIFATLQYDPTDLLAIEKYIHECRKFIKNTKTLEEIQINSGGTAKGLKDMTVVKVMENRLKKMFNAAFGKGSYEMVFRSRRPFASVGGRLFYSSIIKGLADYIAAPKNLL